MAEAAVLTPPSAPPITTVDEEGLYLKGLVYGEPGAGKTYLGCTMPDPIILLTEGDVARPTILKAQRDLGRKIPIWPIKSVSDLTQAFAYLRAGDHPYKSVVLDSISDMNWIVKAEVLGAARAKKASHDPDTLELQDWDRVGERMRKIILHFRDLENMHVLMLARLDEPMEGVRTPALQPKKLALQAAAMFNFVGYLRKATDPNTNAKVRVLIMEDQVAQGKDFGGFVDTYVVNPNMSEIIAKIQGEGEV